MSGIELIEINRNPSPRELRWFGGLFALFFAVIGGLCQWRFGLPAVALGIWSVAAIVTVAYYLLPVIRRPLYIGWMMAALPIGWLVSHLLLALTFYVVITPIGLVMRLAGYDAMRRRLDADAATYWVKRDPADATRYFRQF